MDGIVVEWLSGGDTGMSSMNIVTYLEGRRVDKYKSHPHDPSDLGRCIRLLDKVPLYRERLHEMKNVSPTWSILVDHWTELETLYRQEESSGRAPKCYARMQEVVRESGGKF